MKKLFTLLALIATIAINAQAPQGFNYQATVRNSSGQLLINQIVLIKFNVLQNSSTGTIVYSETQTANTDDLGHIALVVGQGTVTTGTFSTINWGSGSYYLGIEFNTGTGYVAMGTTQLLSVPYALYANNSGNETSIGSISSASNPNGAKITSGVMSLTPADSTNGGIITNNTQTIAGEKTFNSDMKINGITVGRGLGQLSSNTILGRSSLIANTTGDSNTVTGAYSLSSNTTGNSNIAIGNTALGNNTTGNNNIAIGNATLRSNYNGNNNTAIGSSAGVTVDNLTNATAIGYSAVVANSNAIQLGNTAVTSINTSGNYKGNGFFKNGGTSTQYLMADGSVINGSKVIGVLGFDDINANSHINSYESTQTSPLIYSRYFYGQYGDLVIQGQPSLYDGKIHFVTGSNIVGQDPPTQRMVIMSNGNIGVGNFLNSTPKSKLEVQNGDVYIDNSSKGVILKSPNGFCWRVTIDNTGNFIRTNITCPN